MFLSKYGVARHIYIPIPKAGSANHAVSGDWTPAAGDVKISKNGGAAANVTNLPTAIAMGNSTVWDFSLTATEMQAAQVVVTISDSATKAVDDTGFIVETYGNASAQHAFDLGTASTPQTVDAATRMATYTQPTGFLATDFTTLGSNASNAAGSSASAYLAALDAANFASTAATQASAANTRVQLGVPAFAPGTGGGVLIAGTNAAFTVAGDVSISGDFDITGHFRPVDGFLGNVTGDITGDFTGNLQTELTDLITTVGVAGAGLSSVRLSATGLDSIPITAPTGVATTFREMVVQTWRRFFKRTTKSGTQLKTYADNGTSVLTTQNYTSIDPDDDVGAAT